MVIYLHSTMYLLNRDDFSDKKYVYSKFTFHYVSIKSKLVLTVNDSDIYLHSTMYLLNRRCVYTSAC